MPPIDPLTVFRDAVAAWLGSWFSWVNRCLVWVLCWLTVILGPPATFSLFLAAQYNIHGAELSLRELASAARGFFLQSWLWMLANLFVAGAVWEGFSLAGQPGGAWVVLRWIALAVGLVWLAVQFYALPFFMVQERKSIILAFLNGFRAAFSAPLFTLLVLAPALAVGVISLVLVVPLAFGGAGLIAVLAAEAAFARARTYTILDE